MQKLKTEEVPQICSGNTDEQKNNMEVREKVKIVISVASLVAATVLIVAEYRRRRHRRKQTSPLSSCYLHSELKPQFGFKRVLADNSYSGFKHLKVEDGSSASSIGGFDISQSLKFLFGTSLWYCMCFHL